MIEIFIFTNGLFLGILFLIIPSEIRKANILLSLFLFSLSLELLPDLFNEGEFLWLDTSLLTVPFLFLYIRQIIRTSVRWLDWLIIIPALAANFLAILAIEPSSDLWVTVPFYAFNVYFLFFIYRAVQKHQIYLYQQYANTSTKTLAWIKGVVVIFLMFHLIWILEDLARFVGLDGEWFSILSEILTLLVVFWIGYYGLSQQASDVTPNEDEKKDLAQVNPEDKETFESIKKSIEKSKLYVNQELTLRSLSLQLNVNEKQLSSWINCFTKNNFYTFINQYRVEEFKTQLSNSQNENLSLLGIAQNAGFRNKSTFYKAFKAIEGHTPSQYKKSLKTPEKV